jgi:hypothetical protein
MRLKLVYLLLIVLLHQTVWAQTGKEALSPMMFNTVLEKHTDAIATAKPTPLFKTNHSRYPFISNFDEPSMYDSLWSDKQVTAINYAVVFNAQNAQGTTYGGNSGNVGECDILTGRSINLFLSEKRTYIMFRYNTGSTWQPNDSLLLQFRTSGGNYQTIWVSPSTAIAPTDVIIQLSDLTNYMAVDFNFRFVNYASQSSSNTETFIVQQIVLADKWSLPAHEAFMYGSVLKRYPSSQFWNKNPLEISPSGPLNTQAVIFNSFKRDSTLYGNNGISGYADTLQSHLMDITQFPVGDSVFLRFYFRATPSTRSSDSLYLVLRNNTGEWIPVWSAGKGLNNDYRYVQQMINFGRFRHSNFQFRLITSTTYSNNDTAQFLVGGIHIGNKVYVPFLDDFSSSIIFPDKQKWLTNSTYVNAEFAIKPPSINVATFDGLDSRGQPYGLGRGYCDTLLSKSFNLNGLKVSDSVYLSFFVQPRGFGENPNNGDSLILELRDNPCLPNQYRVVWMGSAFNLSKTEFTRVDILLKDSFWFHDDFQFRYKNLGSRTGNLNHWHVDYIRFDKGRQAGDAYRDIAVTQKPSSLLTPYSSMPWNHFQVNPALFMRNSDMIQVRNNFDISVPIEFSRVVRAPNNSPVDSFANLFGNFVALTHLNIPLNDPITLGSGSFTSDTIAFNTRYRAVIEGSSDNIVANNTVVVPTFFSNYYAYDDGSAESGYGIEIEPGAVALAYNLMLPDTLFGISMFFNRSYLDVSLRAFDLMVWQEINTNGNGTGETVLKRYALQSPQYKFQYNGFHYFKFDEPLALPPGKFYIGWEQDQVFNLNVGWDENFTLDTAPSINPNLAYRVRDLWYMSSAFKGTPMMRPIVGKWLDPPVGLKKIKSSHLSDHTLPIEIYPNPASRQVRFITHTGGEIKVLLHDLQGRKILETTLTENILDLPALSEGIYVIQVTNSENKSALRKLVIQHQ